MKKFKKTALYQGLEKQKGVGSLMGVMFALVVIGGVYLGFAAEEKETIDKETARAVGEHLEMVGKAVDNYIATNLEDIKNLRNAADTDGTGSGRTCLAANKYCVISISTLAKQGYLPLNFSNVNPYGSDYDIILKKEGSDANPIVNGYVLTKRTWLDSNGNPDYTQIGRAIQHVGIKGGYNNQLAGQGQAEIFGYEGGWRLDAVTDLPMIPSDQIQPGTMAYVSNYNTDAFSIFLRRDGTLPMEGTLDMNGNDIKNILNFNATGNGKIDGKLDVGGKIQGKDNIESDKDVIAKGDVKGDNLIGNKLTLKQGDTGNDLTFAFNGGDNKFHMTLPNSPNGGLVIQGNNNGPTNVTIKGDMLFHNLLVGNPNNTDLRLPTETNNLSKELGYGVIVTDSTVLKKANMIVRDGKTMQDVDNYVENVGGDNTYNSNEGSTAAVLLKNNGMIYADNIYLRDRGALLSDILPVNSSRGSWTVTDGTLIMKPNCSRKDAGKGDLRTNKTDMLTNKNTVPRVIITPANQYATGEFNTLSGFGVTQFVVKAIDKGDYWQAYVKMRTPDNELSPAGQAIAHVYCSFEEGVQKTGVQDTRFGQ